MSKVFTKYYIDDAEEAHNLYVSTLPDRGLIGLTILVLLFYFISRIKIPKNVFGDSMYFFIAIKFAVYVRMFHWFFTGMLWQYYFWIEVVILISANAYYLKISNDKE
jgi:O-antigen ligase